MTRRDIIIIAVLANIAVLAILFMLAFRTDEDKIEEQPDIAYTIIDNDLSDPLPQSEMRTVKAEPLDEMDKVIEELTPTSTSAYTDDDGLAEDESEQANPLDETSEEAPKIPENTVEITVKQGDALEKIAKANGTTVESIMRINNLRSDKLKIGQVLRVPVKTVKTVSSNASTLTVSKPPKPIAQEQIQYYTIKNGDNLWKIAKQFKVKVDDLLLLNNLDEESARKLKAGDQIRVK